MCLCHRCSKVCIILFVVLANVLLVNRIAYYITLDNIHACENTIFWERSIVNGNEKPGESSSNVINTYQTYSSIDK